MHLNPSPTSLLDIPKEVWQCCIFEYWLGPIHQINFNSSDEIMKFKSLTQSKIVSGLDLMTVRAVHRFCCLISRKIRNIFVVEMIDFWRRVSNILEVVVYWKRYESMDGMSLARGDLSVYESIQYVKMQKLIEATEMNLNREYADIIDPSNCSYGNDDVDLKNIKNELDTEEINRQFEKRIQKLMISDEKFEKIALITQLDAYDLFLHKAHMISLEMVAQFNSEKHSEYYYSYDTFENCRLISQGLFTKNVSDSQALGLMIDMNENEDYSLLKEISRNYICISFNFIEWGYYVNDISNCVNHVQYLCFNFGNVTDFEVGPLYSDFLSEVEVFPNVRDITIQIDRNEDPEYEDNSHTIERNIMSAITRTKFPKLIRLSLQGFSKMDNLLDIEILSELLYVEIIPLSCRNYETINHWSEGGVNRFVNRTFIENDSLIHHFLIHANISRIDGDVDHESLSDFYNLSSEKFVPSITHSSIIDYYDKCYE